jgi:DnaJ-class molecular chaperone
VPDWVKTESLEASLVTDEQAGDIACEACGGAGIINVLPTPNQPRVWVRCSVCKGSGCDPSSDRFKGGIIDPRDR